MNRQVLYQGKSKNNGEWVEGSLQKHTTVFVDGEEVHTYRITTIQEGADCLSCDSDLPYNPTYMQGVDEVVEWDTIREYLGKEDINDRKLFEGDIVKCILTRNQKECVGVIKYSTLNAEYMIKTVSGSLLPFAMFYRHEIIGNKWDNPELLTDKT